MLLSRHPLQDSRSGSALVIVLGLLSVLLLMGVSFAVTMRTERSGATNMRHAALARHVLDSALARTMADLDVELRSYEEDGEFFGNSTPTNLVVLSSYDEEAEAINLLSHEIARNLPSDQLAASLYTLASWKPIYGGVRVTDLSDSDPTADDPPVGRYAFVVLNNCGMLDPNLVATTNRSLGLSASEIQLADNTSSKIFNNNKNGRVSAFTDRRKSDHHYTTMRDFLNKNITNIIYNPPPKPNNGKFEFSTNSFAIGSFAIDDLAPPSKVDGKSLSKYKNDGDTATPYRLPKCSLVDDNGDLLNPATIKADKAQEIADAFHASFQSTWAIDDKAKSLKKKILSGGAQVELPDLAARILLDAMDDDVYPGGTTPHDLDKINKGTESYDRYMALLGYKQSWDRFPCTEPVPMLDNLVIVGGSELTGTPGLKRRPLEQTITDAGGNTSTVTTGVEWTVTISMLRCSMFYPGWNVPKIAEDTYAFNWYFSSVDSKSFEFKSTKSNQEMQPFQQAFKKALQNLSTIGVNVDGTLKLSNSKAIQRRTDADDREIFSFKFSMPYQNGQEPPLPDKIGFTMYAIGYVSKGGNDDRNIVQFVPCLQGKQTTDQMHDDDMLELFIVMDTESMKKDTLTVLAGTYCVDPMFAYNKDCWIPSLSLGEDPDQDSINKLRKAISYTDPGDGDLNDMYLDGPNPIAKRYLTTPYKKYGKQNVYEILSDVGAVVGGISDVMWANPNQDDDFALSTKDKASKIFCSFYFDPDHETNSFNRVGQLGFLPIGTHRTISLLDGFGPTGNKRIPRQRVLDYFTLQPPRKAGTTGSDDETPGSAHKAAILPNRLNLNPPRTVRWKKVENDGTTTYELVTSAYNLNPFTAALTGCPLHEWKAQNGAPTVSWDDAQVLAECYAMNIDRKDDDARDEDVVDNWNTKGHAHDLSILGRAVEPSPNLGDLDSDSSWDVYLRNELDATCDFEREGIIRNSSELFTARQQLFTILLKADSFTPKFGFNDASHGTSMASVQAIAHVWRDPDPLRDASGRPIRDKDGNTIHPWMLLDLTQF